VSSRSPGEGRGEQRSWPPPLSSREKALARSRTYQLLSRLVLEGVTPESLPTLQALPELAQALPHPLDLDRLAAAHHRLWGFNVFPFEGIFRGTENLLGGPVTEQVLHSYARSGFQPELSSQSGDHLGLELAFLAFLAGAEADAWEDDRPHVARTIQERQRLFLDEHLLPWLPALVQAVGQQLASPLHPPEEQPREQSEEQSEEQPGGQSSAQELGIFVLAVELALELALVHRQELGEADLLAPGPSLTLPLLPDLLEEESTGLKEIAAHLLVPAYSGFYLSRDDIGRLAQRHQLPRGFGERRTMLTNLLQAAARFDSLPGVLTSLEELVAEWRKRYRTPPVADYPFMQPIAQAWGHRLQATLGILEVLRAGSVDQAAN